MRNSAIDIFRSLAILAVVFYHYNSILPYGYIGVDLFFVISGFLVGGIAIKRFNNNDLNYPTFVLERGFKIWPSYFFFFIVAEILTTCFLPASNHVESWDLKRFVFFYQNYTGTPVPYSFAHVWSLCVEEHFYLILPAIFIFLLWIKSRHLFTVLILGIAIGIIFKVLTLYFTHSKETYAATHVRIDGLTWGVLLNAVLVYKRKLFDSMCNLKTFFIGLIVFISTIVVEANTTFVFFHKVIFHSILPLAFALMLLGVYKVNFKIKPLQYIARHSYNWYLWHPVVFVFCSYFLGLNFLSFIIYLVVSFLMAIVATEVIEKPFLKLRTSVISGKGILRKVTLKVN